MLNRLAIAVFVVFIVSDIDVLTGEYHPIVAITARYAGVYDMLALANIIIYMITH